MGARGLAMVGSVVVSVVIGCAAVVPTAPTAAAHHDEFEPHPVIDDAGSMSWATAVSEQSVALFAVRPEWDFSVAGRRDQTITVGLRRENHTIDFAFSPAVDGEPLTVGTYVGAASTPGSSTPGLTVTGAPFVCGDEQPRSRFVVHELAPDLSRLRITYEFRCNDQQPSLIGELSLNQPRQPGFEIAPRSIGWPERGVGRRGYPMPVTLTNTGRAPLRVAAVDVTRGLGDFAVLHDTCGTVPAGAFCRAHVVFQPAAPGYRTGELTFRTNRGERRLTLTGRGSPGDGGPPTPRPPRGHVEEPAGDTPRVTRWQMEGSGNSWIGENAVFSTEHLRQVGGDDVSFWLDMRLGDTSYHAYFRTAADAVLLPGTTVTPTRNTYPDGPYDTGAVRVSGRGRGCSIADAAFTVHESTFDRTGRLVGLALTYRYRCFTGSYDGETRGSIAWNATCIPAMPESAAEGSCVRPGSATVRRTTALELVAQRLRSGRARLSGRLTPAGAGQRIELLRRAADGRRWKVVRRATTVAGGRFVAAMPRVPTGSYRARYLGTTARTPAISPPARLRR